MLRNRDNILGDLTCNLIKILGIIPVQSLVQSPIQMLDQSPIQILDQTDPAGHPEGGFALSTELRHRQILDLVEKKGVVSVEALAESLFISPSSIRRDLAVLASQGLLKRSHGGAIAASSIDHELPISYRVNEQRENKRIIGKLAATLVKDNDFLFLDSSTTTQHMVPFLSYKTDLTIFSNGAQTTLMLGQNSNHRVYSTGGLLRRHTSSYVGDIACESLSKYNVNKMFFSCTSIDIDNGITTANEDEAALRRFIMKRSKSNILLIDSSKFDRAAFCTISGFEGISHLVTDREPTPAWRDLLDAKGVKVLFPKP